MELVVVLDGGYKYLYYLIVLKCYRETAGKLAITYTIYRFNIL